MPARGSKPARRPWWKWIAVAVLLVATLAVTAVYATTLAHDFARQHWTHALDASREAVLVIVGWAAVIIVLSGGRDSKAGEDPPDGRAQSAEQSQRDKPAQPGERDSHREPHDESEPDEESVLVAQQRVHRLRNRLRELAAARERAGSSADPDLDREVASTTARLEHARQWLTSAQSALAVGRQDRRDRHDRRDGRDGRDGRDRQDGHEAHVGHDRQPAGHSGQ